MGLAFGIQAAKQVVQPLCSRVRGLRGWCLRARCWRCSFRRCAAGCRNGRGTGCIRKCGVGMGCHGQGLVFLIGAVFALASCLNRAFRCRDVALLRGGGASTPPSGHAAAWCSARAPCRSSGGPASAGAPGKWLGRFGLGSKVVPSPWAAGAAAARSGQVRPARQCGGPERAGPPGWVTIPRQSRGHSGCEPLKAAVRGR